MEAAAMGLEVYYPKDLRNALLAAEQAMNATLPVTGDDGAEYARGYRAALLTIALAFGLVPNNVQERRQPELPTLISAGERGR